MAVEIGLKLGLLSGRSFCGGLSGGRKVKVANRAEKIVAEKRKTEFRERKEVVAVVVGG